MNEDEATLPIKSDVAPYYHWNDFKEYCLKSWRGIKGKMKATDCWGTGDGIAWNGGGCLIAEATFSFAF